MQLPYTSPQGESYEGDRGNSSNIFTQIRINGTDPFTREPLAEHQMIPNRSLQTANFEAHPEPGRDRVR